MTRFRPSRAGLINIWDYVDEEFVFADGRLVLRGHNGSGKTKALEVLFPFILDGVADARRLDPFSGENRTMKSNLLYRGQDSEYGFVWMEFADADRVVTLIIALRAHKDRPAATTSFFVTRKRVGVDFGLLTADGRPLTERQLTQVLGRESSFATATEYRAAIDAELFGLGTQRYTQLIDLLLALRRPLLAKDLDPDKVSATLTAGLSPVSEELVDQAARDFENLAAVQKLVEDLTAADEAAREFLAVYGDYLRVYGRHRLERVSERTRQAAGRLAKLRASAAEEKRAAEAEQAATAARGEAEQRRAQLTGTLDGLKQDDAYKGQERLESLRNRVAAGADDLARRQKAHASAGRRLAELKQEAEAAFQRIEGHRSACAKEAAEQEQAARAAGIEHDDADLVTVKARAAARREDIRQVRERLAEADAVEREQRRKEEARAAAEAKLERADERREQAEEAVRRAREEVERRLGEWTERWAPRPGDPDPIVPGEVADALAAALEEVSGPGAAALTSVFAELTQEHHGRLVAAQARVSVDLDQRRKERRELIAERDRIAAETDDAPDLPPTRSGDRTGRPGAAFWQLVRFADHVDSAQAASLEAALEAAGLLTAWVHPDPAMIEEALAQGDDAYLRPLPESGRPSGRTLADVLLPEEQEHVPASVLTGILSSIALLDGLGPDAPAPAVGTGGRFTYGVQVGSCGKPRPEYIGATYRAARRAERVAAHDRRIAELSAGIAELEARSEHLDELLRQLQQAKKELPPITGILRALTEVSKASALLADARREHVNAASACDAALANTDAARRRLRQTAGGLNLPAEPDALEAVEHAVADLLAAAERRHGELLTANALEEAQKSRNDMIEELEAEHLENAEDLLDKEQEQERLALELATLESSLSAPLKEVLERIRATEAELEQVSRAWNEADEAVRREHDARIRATADCEHHRRELEGTVVLLLEAARDAAPFTEPDLRPVLGITTRAVWPHPALWPSPEEACARLLERPASEPPEQAVDAVLPEEAAELLRLLDEATRGRPCGETSRKNARQGLSAALQGFNDVLGAREEDYRLEWEPAEAITDVRVYDADGRHSVAEFAARTAERAEEQRFLLEENERTVLEDELLSSLSQQIFDRVFVARELVAGMDADTRSRPMSNGTVIGIRWVASPKITDLQREVSALLDHEVLGSEQLARLRGLLRQMLREYRAAHPRATYKEALAEVLDYRTWRSFELRVQSPGEKEVTLSRRQHSLMSGGEKSAAIHLPLFAAANALYGSAKPDCPRMIALDEAFAGIDDRYKPDLLGLTVQYRLDVFMTGHDLWVRYDTVPAAAHYDMHSDKASHTVSAVLILWDGTELVDSGAGFSGNEELAAELLGFTPSRRAPIESGLLEPALSTEGAP